MSERVVCIKCAPNGVERRVVYRGGTWHCPVHKDRGHMRPKPVQDEIDRLREALREYAQRIEDDRREPDKLLCHALSMRSMALSTRKTTLSLPRG